MTENNKQLSKAVIESFKKKLYLIKLCFYIEYFITIKLFFFLKDYFKNKKNITIKEIKELSYVPKYGINVWKSKSLKDKQIVTPKFVFDISFS